MASKLPIFIISGKSPLDDPGGYPAYAHTLSHILTTLNHKVYILAISKNASVEKTEHGEIHFLTTKLLSYFPFLQQLALAGLPYYSIIFAKEIKKIVLKEKISNFMLWGMGPWALPGVILKYFLPAHVKMVMIASYFTSTRHEMKGAYEAIRIKDYGIIPKIRYFLVYEVVARIFHIFEKITLDHCNLIITHYKSSGRIIKKYFNVQAKKIYLFPWYNEIFKREGKESNVIKQYKHPLIVSICRQDPRKGINFIIRAVQIVSKKIPSVYCLIVGSGSFLKLNQKLVENLKLGKNICVTGFVSDIHPILSEADIAVIVPLAQGSSALTVLEAMSYGKAIIGSNCDGIPEDITHNVNGIIVERGNEQALADAMIRLIKNGALRKRLGQATLKTYKNRFGFEKMKIDIKNALAKHTKEK